MQGSSWNKLSSSEIIDTEGNWLYKRQADSKTLRACQNTPQEEEDLTDQGNCVKHCERTSVFALTHRKSESHGTVRRLPLATVQYVGHAKESRHVSVAKPDDRRIDSGGTPQERNPVEVRGQDLEQDTETETHTSESLTMWLRQVQQRRGEGQRKALSCLILNKSARKTPCEPRTGWRRLRRMQ